jgi:hypothetical protein
LRFQSHLPLQFWGDCVLTATHIINRIPTPNLSNKSPYQLLFSKIPSYLHLRVFGCLCYSSTLTRNWSKFDARAKPCVFIGYPPNSECYKLFDLVSKSVFVSRDVIFHENVFPFASNFTKFNSDGCLVLPTPILDHPSSSFSPHVSVSSEPLPIESSLYTSSLAPITHSSLSKPLKKSTRVRSRPRYLQNYHCNIATQPGIPISSTMQFSSNQHDISFVLDYHSLSNSYKHFCLSVSSHFEPKFFHQAVKFPHWHEAMAAEIRALETNNTWLITDFLPTNILVGVSGCTR